MELIVISDPLCFKTEAKLLNQLFELGMPVFHLRKPDISRLVYSRLISEIDYRYHDRIALHQFHDLLIDFPAIRRLHYPENKRNEHLINSKLAPHINNYTLSTSIHNLNDLSALGSFNYTFFGPVFDSISKSGYAGLKAADLVLEGRKAVPKIIALGGIDTDKVAKVKLMGFDGLAILGALWNNKAQCLEKFKELNEKCR